MTAPSPAHSLPPYPAYRPSGVAWLGDVPAHWEVRRLKTICRLAYGDSLPAAHQMPGDIPVYGSNGLVGYHTIPNTDGQCIIIGRKGSFGKVHYSDQSAFAIDTAFFIDQRYTSANIRWLYYLLGWLKLDAFSKDSAIPGLNRNDAYQHIGLLPPPEEQAAIVRYLDDAVARINRAREVKTRQAELLQEYRQAAIHHAVTRGLNPDAPLKPSGVPWLGEVPAHWEVRRLKYCATLIMGQSPSAFDCSDQPIGLPFLQGCAEFGQTYPTPAQFCSAPKKVAPAGAILLSVRAPVGQLNISDQPYAIGRGLCAILPIDHICKRQFAYYHLLAIQHGLRAAASGTTYDAVRVGDVGNQPIILPPPEEQAAIVAHLDQLTAKLVAAIAGVRQSAALLDEYRAALIAAVVTGQVDTRAALSCPLTAAG